MTNHKYSNVTEYLNIGRFTNDNLCDYLISVSFFLNDKTPVWGRSEFIRFRKYCGGGNADFSPSFYRKPF